MQNPFAIVPIKGISSPASKDKPMEGGKWKIVEEFNGKSHEDGGIDIEVSGGVVKRIHAPYDKPDEIAKKGKFWKGLASGAYGFAEGFVDAGTFGLTDKYTDQLYGKIEDKMGGTESEKRERASIRGYSTAAGAMTNVPSMFFGAGIQQTTKGLGEGISKGSPDSKFAQQVGYYLPKAGSAVNKAMFGVWDDNTAKMFGMEGGAIRDFTDIYMGPQKAAPQGGPGGPAPSEGPMPEMQRGPAFPQMPYPRQGGALRQEIAGAGSGGRGTGGSGIDLSGIPQMEYGEMGGPLQLRPHPIYSAQTQDYLNKYGVNV